ncbi:hypothetical protein C5C56_15460 [Rathayibacter sp. AY1D1]|uniref:hypothetical protein n=1 Tax=Rathayibacter sp. AY1D1 TaxID=2080542 RepID=UPI000CE75DDC|nr:hypothetical protein [Rathayibacter sp. AY1D1]PPH96026.1 hypothetical protein C5C56_15460 [Rathayibacter sp. AY1D1]
MSTSSVDAYMRALRWYPAAWRDANAEAVVGAFLDRDEAIGTEGPTPRDRKELAWAGLRETFVGAGRQGRRSSSAIGLLFLLAAWSYGSVVLEVGGRTMATATGGNVDTMGRSYAAPVLLAVVLVALAWLCTANASFRRGRPLLAAVIGLCALGAGWTTFHLSWSSLVPPLELGSPLLAMSLLSVTALAAPILAAAAATKAELLEKAALWIISVAVTVHVAGTWLLSALDRPRTAPEVLLVIGCAFVAPACHAITGLGFVFLSRSSSNPRQPAHRSAETTPEVARSAQPLRFSDR